MQKRSVHRPSAVIPDKDSAVIAPSEAKSAFAMRIGNASPTMGVVPVSEQNSGIYKVLGNIEIPNSLLPSGLNKCLGWVQDESKDRLVFANWNENGNHAIYQYRNGVFDQVISLSDFSFDSEIDMNLRGEILVWTDNIEEPRTINISKAIAGEYGSIQDWMISQLHRRPSYPLQITATILDIAGTLPKPVANTSEVGYQFGYNYEYFDFIESRISDPTIVNWNNNITLTVPSTETNQYIMAGGVPNPYIVAVKFYYRLGNTGGWNLFLRKKNEAIWDKTVSVGILTELVSIGGVTASALNEVDGIGRRVKNNYFADNRLIHAGIFDGYEIELPTASLSLDVENDLVVRKYRAFPPIDIRTDTAIIYFDKYDRIIGGRNLGVFETLRQDSYAVDLNPINIANPGFFASNPAWNQVVDYNEGTLGYANSRLDLRNLNSIVVTPSGTVNPVIEKAVLATKVKNRITNFLRTITRPYWIYKDKDGNFIPSMDTKLGKSFNDNNVLFSFYGIGFAFESGEPINFSTQQNYFVEIFGLTRNAPFGGDAFRYYSGDFRFKITDQFGDILISEMQVEEIEDGPYEIGNLNPNIFSIFTDYRFGAYSHYIADVCLYSKSKADDAWVLVPEVSWNQNELIAGTPKSYYGPNYVSRFKSTLAQESRRALSGYSNAVINNYWNGLIPIQWEGWFGTMNLNGNFLETWDSDTGQTVAIEENPIELNLTNSLRHGGQALTNTKVNNLFSFDPQNETSVSSQLGPITRTQSLALDSTTGENLHIVCQLGSVAMFLGRTLVQDNSGNPTLATSDQVFGSKNVYQQKFGARRLYDVVTTDKGLLFFYDSNKKALCQISNNGVDVISDQRSFKSDTNRFEDQSGSFIGYDPFYLEVFAYQAQGEGLAYNFKTDTYQGQRPFGGGSPSEMFAYLGRQAFSFYQGRLFLLNSNERTQFNGEDYLAKVVMVSNAELIENKDFQYLVFKSDAGNKWTFRLFSDNGAETNITTNEFIDRKNYFEASIKRDVNSAGGKYNGQFMDGAFLTIEISDFDNEQKDLIFVELGYSNALTNG